MCMPMVQEGQEMIFDLLKLELQMVVRCLEIELGSSGKAASALSH